MPAASLQHSDRPTSEGLDNHRIRQVALANQQTTQEAGFLVNPLRHHPLLSAVLSQLNLVLAPALVAASLVQNLEPMAASLDKATLLRRPSKVVAFLVLPEEQMPASAQELALGPDLVVEAVYLVATMNNSNNSRNHSHLVGQLPRLEEVLGLAAVGSAPITILQPTPTVVYSAMLARPTLLLGKLSSSPLNKTHSAALGLKIKTRAIANHLSEALVPSSNKSKSQAVYSAAKLQITQGGGACLGT